MNPLLDLSADSPLPAAVTKTVSRLETSVRQNPGTTLLLAASLGVAAILLTRALTPPPPHNRAVHLLEDIQQRLAGLAEDSGQAVDKGMDSLGNLHLDRSFDKLGRGFKGLFQ